MRRVPDREERLAGLFVVIGAIIVFAPLVWISQRWSREVARDPTEAWGAGRLVEHLSAHPYLTGVALIFGILLTSGLVMLIVVYAAMRIAARLTDRG